MFRFTQHRQPATSNSQLGKNLFSSSYLLFSVNGEER